MKAHFKPEGWPSVVPRLLTSDVPGLVTFLHATFGASGDVASGRPSEIKIGDAVVLVSDGGGRREMSPAFLYVYVEDTDDTHRRAIESGARTVELPMDTPYGDRRATVQDAWGNTWQIATHRRP